jgi:hypothetical protein
VKKNDIFLDFREGNSFREYFLNKPGNLFSNFDILLGTSQRTIYMKLPIVSFFTLNIISPIIAAVLDSDCHKKHKLDQ